MLDEPRFLLPETFESIRRKRIQRENDLAEFLELEQSILLSSGTHPHDSRSTVSIQTAAVPKTPKIEKKLSTTATQTSSSTSNPKPATPTPL
ncbi:hypothetical protein GEMRC1_000526 [Eukaryota sp. GEM-RC1]